MGGFMCNLNSKKSTFFVTLILVFSTHPLLADSGPLKQGVKAYKSGHYTDAALSFYNLTISENSKSEQKAQANYYLGLSLYKLKLYQASSLPIIAAIKTNSKKYRSPTTSTPWDNFLSFRLAN